MKYLRTLSAYARGIRWPMFVLSFMMTVAMLIGVITVGKLRYIRRHYDIVAGTSADTSRMYYYMTLSLDIRDDRTRALIEKLEAEPAVEGVYGVHFVSPVSYQEEKWQTGISVQLLNPRLLTLFPGLGLTLSENDETVIGARVFRDVPKGETITLIFPRPNRQVEFTVAGHLGYPYSYLTFGGGSNRPMADDLFHSQEVLLMLATPENIERFSGLATVQVSENFMVEFRADATREQIDAVLEFLAGTGNTFSLDEILARSTSELETRMRSDLPLPVMMLLISAFAYFSTMIMAFKQKERDLAIFHLCGATRGQCIGAVVGTFARISLVPVAISTALVALLPEMDWLWMFTMGEYVIDEWCYLVIGGYFAASLAVSAAAVWVQMMGHTPLTLLRGVEK